MVRYSMGKKIEKRIQQFSFDSSEQKASLSILILAEEIKSELEKICEAYGLTHPKYNVLRILKGAYPSGLPRYEITKRLLEKAPDVTRLIDRLIKKQLVIRTKSPTDGRMSMAMITKKGISLVNKINPEIHAVHEDILGKLKPDDQNMLINLINKLLEQ